MVVALSPRRLCCRNNGAAYGLIKAVDSSNAVQRTTVRSLGAAAPAPDEAAALGGAVVVNLGEGM